jgi:uncharacterized membrane protein YdjX (TVP38/TMEM64 family)
LNRSEKPAVKGFAWRRLIPLFILLAALTFAVSMGWHHYLSLTALRDHQTELRALVAQHGAMAGIAFTVIYAIVIAVSIPGGLILTLCGGFLFGALAGMLYVVVGATLGATGVFLAARTAVGDAFRRRAGPFLQKMEDGFRENEMSYMLVLRLIPLFPFWLVNIVPAILGVSLRSYVIGTFIGIIPATFVFASVGAGLSSLLETFDPENPPNLASIILEPRYLLPIAGLAVLSVLPILYKKLKSRKESNTS